MRASGLRLLLISVGNLIRGPATLQMKVRSVAFATDTQDLPSWEAWLAENGIAIEDKRTWQFGGQSLYFRDPDRHLLEVATPGVWSIC